MFYIGILFVIIGTIIGSIDRFTWRLPSLGRVADVMTILGVPAIAISTWKFYAQYRDDLAARREIKAVSQGCLEFSDDKAAINLVPLETITAAPRPGDVAVLPGENHDGVNFGGGVYEGEHVSFSYREAPEVDQPCPATPSKIIAHVRKKERQRLR